MCDGARGAPLIPWPNGLADGHRFGGIKHQVALTEPENPQRDPPPAALASVAGPAVARLPMMAVSLNSKTSRS
jgi:hypothetical protein